MGSYTNTQGSSQPAQSQQYGGGPYNPLYGQLAQMMYGGGGGGGYSPFFNAGYGYGMPQQQQQQPVYQPAFWQSLLQNMYQPQTPTQTATGYLPGTDYAQMLAQANPGGQPVAGTAYVPPPPLPPPAPAAPVQTQTAQAPNQAGVDMGGSAGEGASNSTGPSADAGTSTSGESGGDGTAAHGGRILPNHHYGHAYGGHIHHHALQIAADAAPPYSNPTAAAGRRFKSS